MKEYIFNDCDVCVNPNEHYIDADKIHCTIKTMESSRGWSGAFDVFGPTYGCGGPVTAEDYDDFFPSEQELISTMAQKIIDYLNVADVPDKVKSIVNKLKDLVKPQPIQLSLF
jgi:hypothetical protein